MSSPDSSAALVNNLAERKSASAGTPRYLGGYIVRIGRYFWQPGRMCPMFRKRQTPAQNVPMSECESTVTGGTRRFFKSP